jgi:NADPH:quinone reductase-like Zn-dependent oxidoreductase
LQDVYALAGKVETKDSACSLDCAGVVRAAGKNVQSLSAGDRVVVMAPGHFQTVERYAEFACLKLEQNEKFEVRSFHGYWFGSTVLTLRRRLLSFQQCLPQC